MNTGKLPLRTYFPKQYTARPDQLQILDEVESVWNESDVIILRLPTAFGKSATAKAIMDWNGGGAYVAPNNLLVKQYQETFPKMPTLYGKDYYQCCQPGYSKCVDREQAFAKTKKKFCDGCPYTTDLRRMMSRYRKYSNTNMHLFVARQLHLPLLILDEAHNAINFLQDWNSVKIRRDQWQYPVNSGGRINRHQLLEWIHSLKNWQRIVEEPAHSGEKGISVLYRDLESSSPRFLIKEEESDRYDRSTRSYYRERTLVLTPVDIRGLPSPLWPSNKVRKIVLMSATFASTDLHSLGLDSKRVTWIDADSPIPADSRPVLVHNSVGPINYHNTPELIPTIAERCIELINQYPGEKGLIHTTYQMAELLNPWLAANTDRCIFHNRNNKTEQYNKFRASTTDSVLVASGMYEGIDLPYDAGRFQVVTKVPWPSLADPAIRFHSEANPGWYRWEATRTMLQSYGRICRTTEDTGITHILDGSFQRLLEEDSANYPHWFTEALLLEDSE